MSNGDVLIESQDLNGKNGTGIATYVRTLAVAVREIGYNTTALFSTNVPLSTRNDVFRDIAISDASYRLSLTARLRRNLNWVVGSPRGIRPLPVETSGAVVNPSRAGNFKAFNRCVAATNLYTQGRRTLSLYGRFADIRLEEPPAIFHASRPVPIRVPNRPNVYTLHDIVPLRLPYASLDRKRFYYKQLKEILRTADKIVTVSDYTRDDLCDFFPYDAHRITTTYQTYTFPVGTRERSEDAVREELEHAYGLEYGKYFIHVGTIEPKKNISRLVEAFSASKTKHPLIIVGSPGWLCEEDLAHINNDRFLRYRLYENKLIPDRRVRHMGFLPRSRVVSLLRGARALIFPSIYEGFGLPVLEAMVLGVPVITSNVSALPEIAGDAALFVNPYDVDEMTSAINQIDVDEDLRLELISRGRTRGEFFSPERYADRFQGVYKELLGS